jgi:plasmid stabilization system protein ParE
MSAKLVVSNAARLDARNILDYLQEHAGDAIALRYAVDFDAAIDRVADLPHTGSPRQQYGPDIRIVIVDPYLIFYSSTPSGDEVRVLRILHGSRNITRSMLRSVD